MTQPDWLLWLAYTNNSLMTSLIVKFTRRELADWFSACFKNLNSTQVKHSVFSADHARASPDRKPNHPHTELCSHCTKRLIAEQTLFHNSDPFTNNKNKRLKDLMTNIMNSNTFQTYYIQLTRSSKLVGLHSVSRIHRSKLNSPQSPRKLARKSKMTLP